MTETTMLEGGPAHVQATVKRHSGLLLVQAVLMVIAGLLAFVYPLMTSLAVTLFLGWMLIFSGIFQGIALVASSKVPHFWLQLVSAVLALITGFLFIRNPAVAVTTLALLLIVYFMVEGIAKIAFSLSVRPLPSWGWLLASGVVSVVIALWLIANPAQSIVFLGLFIGIQLISEGVAIGWMAWHARNS